jgi:uncharacterized membrane protein
MIEILPNWHPVFVHFTIALLSMAVVFYLLKAVLPANNEYQTALRTLAKTNLLIGTGFAVITAIAGWLAYNSVAHDTPSHLAMTTHRNWALITLAVFIVLALWSLWQKQKTKIFFLFILLIAGGLLAITGRLGAEAVYRYGLGVQSIPKSSAEGHAHQHAEGKGHKKMVTEPISAKPQSEVQTSHDKTPHEHVDSIKHISNKEKDQTDKSHNETLHTH